MDDRTSEHGGDPSGQRPARAGRGRRIGACIAASAVLLGTGIGIGVAVTGGASAATSASAPNPSATGQAARHCAEVARELAASGHPVAAQRARALCETALLRLILARGIHGQVTYTARSGFATLAFERGIVESATSSAVTVQAADGTSWTWDVVPGTVVRQAGHIVPEGTLANGDNVLVVGQVVSGVYDARLIRIRTAS